MRWKLSLFALLTAILLGAAVLPPECQGEGLKHADIPYTTAAGVPPRLLSLDIYTAAPNPAKLVPVVIWIHGGGWKTGDKQNGMGEKADLFTKAGYCLVSANYRLSPDPPQNDNPERVLYPTHSKDVASAVAWVHQNIAAYGGDPARIGLMGHSAGAHLVALVGTDESFLAARGLPLYTIKAVASIDTEGYDIASVMADGALNGIYIGAFGTDPAMWAKASPINHVAAGKGIPPFLFAARGAPARRALCDRMAAALNAAGVKTTIVDAGAYSHSEVNRNIGAPGEQVMTPALLAFFGEAFAPNSRVGAAESAAQ